MVNVVVNARMHGVDCCFGILAFFPPIPLGFPLPPAREGSTLHPRIAHRRMEHFHLLPRRSWFDKNHNPRLHESKVDLMLCWLTCHWSEDGCRLYWVFSQYQSNQDDRLLLQIGNWLFFVCCLDFYCLADQWEAEKKTCFHRCWLSILDPHLPWRVDPALFALFQGTHYWSAGGSNVAGANCP